jgi:hypothetical protein
VHVYKGVREFDLDLPPDDLLSVVWDVRAYPEFVKGVRRVDVLEERDRVARAKFTASLAGVEFEYVLAIHRDDREVRWQQVSGSFKDAGGRMTHLGGPRFRYENWLDPGFHVPDFAVRLVLDRSLPRLIREFQERARIHAERRGAAQGQGGRERTAP